MASQKKIQRIFDQLLKDFEPDTNPKEVWESLGDGRFILKEYRVELPVDLRIYSPFIVFIILVHLKKFPFLGKEEKVAWSIPIKFKGTAFLLSHRKFGFRIIANNNSEETMKMGIEAMQQLQRAIPYAEVLYEPTVREITKKGNITLKNQFIAIQSRYRFFREAAAKEYNKAEKLLKSPPRKSSKEIKSFLEKGFMISPNTFYKHRSAGDNNATAMLDSYFCLIEHVFVLFIPFIPQLKDKEMDLDKFIGLNWKEKLKSILPISTNIEAQKLYERLYGIKENLRNPLTHGYFLRDGNSFYVHAPDIGAIPLALTKRDRKIHYGFSSMGHLTFKEICKCFDDFDAFLANNEFMKFGYAFVKSGLDIFFDKTSVGAYHSKMTSMIEFEELIQYFGMEQDNAANMDW